MTRQSTRVLSLIGLLIGVGTFYTGATGASSGPVPFNQFMTEIDVGIILIIVSVIGLAFSFRKRKTTPTEAEAKATL